MFDVQNSVLLSLTVILFVVKVGALVDCVGREPARFLAIDTLPKKSWLIILGLGLLAHLIDWNPLGILNLVGTVAALVYLAQLRGSSR